ncbi:MAG: 23S rRNA (uracil(1939)-C(5))-methyltransferase RlmD [Massiliimalia sp.]
MVQKNQIFQGEITGMTADGNGVAKLDGFAVFVPGTAMGDVAQIKVVKVLKNYGFGIVHQLMTPSPDRVHNDCPVFKQCGGCCWRHISYEAELRIKEQYVTDTFQRIGGISFPAQPIQGSAKTAGYRNKGQFPVGTDAQGKAVAGFYAKRSHRIIPCSQCLLQPDCFNQIVGQVLEFINRHHIPPYNEENHTGLIRHIYLREADATGEIMLCLVCTKPSFREEAQLVKEITKQFPQIQSIVINHNPNKGNVILGKSCRTIYGTDYITDILCGVKVRISPLSFYQVNKAQAERLYQQAIAYAQLEPEDLLLDLYCGAGTIGLSAAHLVKNLIGVEIIPQAVENAKQNAMLNGFENARFLCDDCKGAVIQLEQEQLHPNAILVDPPRKGCDPEVIESIVRFAPEKLVMISCNPATAARDCKRLEELGYEVLEYMPFDLFPRTSAVECVVKLRKKEK